MSNIKYSKKYKGKIVAVDINFNIFITEKIIDQKGVVVKNNVLPPVDWSKMILADGTYVK